jgi:hypothetical protein
MALPQPRARDAEVGDLDLALEREQQVRRAHVAVHDVERPALGVAQAVRVVEPARRLDHHQQREVERHGLPVAQLLRVQERAQVGALDPFHGDEIGLVGLPDVAHLHDVAVAEQERELGLVDEGAHEVGVARERGRDQLDRDRPLDASPADVDAAVDLAHAAHRDAAEQAKPAEVGCRHASIIFDSPSAFPLPG